MTGTGRMKNPVGETGGQQAGNEHGILVYRGAEHGAEFSMKLQLPPE